MKAKARLEVDLQLPLDRFSLEVKFSSDARVTGIFGASGCGKTSLLEGIAGLRKGVRGRVSWGDQLWDTSAKRVAPQQRQIGYVPQDGLLFPRRSVRANLLSGRQRARSRGLDFERTLANTVDLLELEPLLEQDVDSLSGGERQRVSLARALCSGPRFLLLDEPLSALDLPLRRKLLPYLKRVAHEFELPVLLVSHDPIEVQALCEHLVVLSEGRVIATGSPRNVLTRPEIYPLATHAGFENILPATLASQHDNSSELRLGPGPNAPVLIAPRSERAPGECLLVGIPSDDIILATTRPKNISARNIMLAEITQVHSIERKRLICTVVHPYVPPIWVEVTAMTAAELKLVPGAQVYLLIKTVACQLYDSVATV